MAELPPGGLDNFAMTSKGRLVGEEGPGGLNADLRPSPLEGAEEAAAAAAADDAMVIFSRILFVLAL